MLIGSIGILGARGFALGGRPPLEDVLETGAVDRRIAALIGSGVDDSRIRICNATIKPTTMAACSIATAASETTRRTLQ